MTIRIDGTNTAVNPGITGSDTDTGLQFGTDEVNIVTGGSTAVTVDSSQRVGINTTSPSQRLNLNIGGDQTWLQIDKTRASDEAMIQLVHSTTNRGSKIRYANADSSWVVGIDGSESFVFTSGEAADGSGGTERARIDSSGRLLVGTSTSPSAGQGQYARLAVQGYVGSGGTTGGAYISLQRGEAATAITAEDELGFINFGDSAGNTFGTIACRADGTAGSGDYPGRLVFSTTADGASSPTERLRIRANGNTEPGADNTYTIGTSASRWGSVWAANGTIQTSDERTKTQIANAHLGSEFIKSLRPVSYKWIEGGKRDAGERDEDGNPIYESVPGERTHWGFIAQEVKQAVDAAGVDFGGWVLTDKDDPDSQQALRYDQFIAPLTKALQETMAELEALKAEVAALKGA